MIKSIVHCHLNIDNKPSSPERCEAIKPKQTNQSMEFISAKHSKVQLSIDEPVRNAFSSTKSLVTQTNRNNRSTTLLLQS